LAGPPELPDRPPVSRRLVGASLAVVALGAVLAVAVPTALRHHPAPFRTTSLREHLPTPSIAPLPTLTPLPGGQQVEAVTPPALRARLCAAGDLQLRVSAQPNAVRPQGRVTITVVITNVAATACDPGPLADVEFHWPGPTMGTFLSAPVLRPHQPWAWSLPEPWIVDICNTTTGACRPPAPGYDYRMTVVFDGAAATVRIRVLNQPPGPPPPTPGQGGQL